MDDQNIAPEPEAQDVLPLNKSAAFNPAVLLQKSKSSRVRGRPISQIWSHITDDPEPLGKNFCTCKHCQMVIRHFRKTEVLKAHLSKCDGFKQSISHLDVKDRPTWMVSKTDDKGRKTQQEQLFEDTESTSSIAIDSDRVSEVKGSNNNSPRLAVTEMNRKRKVRDQYSQEVIPMAVYPLVNYNKAFEVDSPDTIPSLSKAEMSRIHELIAMHCYITGISFATIEECHLLKAFQICRPDISLPDTDGLTGPLLENCYKKLKLAVNKFRKKKSNRYICIVVDTWSTMSNEKMINYMAITGNASYFLESVIVDEYVYDAEWIASDIARIIRNNDGTVVGAITDNNSIFGSAWKLLKEIFPNHFFQGCCCQALNLLILDLFSERKLDQADGDTEKGKSNPLDDLIQFLEDCKRVISFVDSHASMKIELTQYQRDHQCKSLVYPSLSNSTNLVECFSALVESQLILLKLAHQADNSIDLNAVQKDELANIRRILSEPQFVELLTKSIDILTMIVELKSYFQTNNVPISDVYYAFKFLFRQAIQSTVSLSEYERDRLCRLVELRFQLLKSDAHLISYLLDPRFIGDGMPLAERRKTEELICSFPCDKQLSESERKEKLFEEYTAYVVAASQEQSANTFQYQMLMKQRKTVLQYWMIDGRRWPLLQQLAIPVFCLPATNKAAEENLSNFVHIYSKYRNTMCPDSLQKIMYIKINNKLFSEDFAYSDTDIDDTCTSADLSIDATIPADPCYS